LTGKGAKVFNEADIVEEKIVHWFKLGFCNMTSFFSTSKLIVCEVSLFILAMAA
jgi:hypothetical protein